MVLSFSVLFISPVANEIYQACVKGEVASVERLLIKAQEEAAGERAEEVMRLRGYLMDNYYGLRDYRVEVNGEGLRGLWKAMWTSYLG